MFGAWQRPDAKPTVLHPHRTTHSSLAPCPCVPKTRPRQQRPRCRLTGLVARTRAPPRQQPSPAPLVTTPLLHLLSGRLDARGTCSVQSLRQARASPGCDVSARAPFTHRAHAPGRDGVGGTAHIPATHRPPWHQPPPTRSPPADAQVQAVPLRACAEHPSRYCCPSRFRAHALPPLIPAPPSALARACSPGTLTRSLSGPGASHVYHVTSARSHCQGQ